MSARKARPGASAGVELAVVVPAWQSAELLQRSLPALLEAAGEAPVIVVDSGSTDGTSDVARRLGARVVTLPERAGPAHARNVGVEHVNAEVVLFIDADCVAHPDTVERVRRHFRDDPDLVTLTGSYCPAPPASGFFSQYMNLRHHHTHQEARRQPATFWAGCGAVRRSAFLAVGGFDAERFPRPLVEDIELSMRMQHLGTTRLDPDLQVTHLKRWTLRSVVQTDVTCRAIPWTRLILESGELPGDLNTRGSQRVAALLSPFVLAAPLVAAWGAASGRWLAVAAAALPWAASLALHAGLIRCFARRRGLLFALGGWLFHQVHLLYSSVTFVLVTARHRLLGARGGEPARRGETATGSARADSPEEAEAPASASGAATAEPGRRADG